MGWRDQVGADWSRYAEAVAVVCATQKGSAALIQRVLYIGYNQAARLIERMEEEGIIGPHNSAGVRSFLRNPHHPTSPRESA